VIFEGKILQTMFFSSYQYKIWILHFQSVFFSFKRTHKLIKAEEKKGRVFIVTSLLWRLAEESV
jgi:beta-xylosidase